MCQIMTKISIFDLIFTTLCKVLNTTYLIAFCTRLGMTPKKGQFLILPKQCVFADFSKIIPGLHQRARSESRHHFRVKNVLQKIL